MQVYTNIFEQTKDRVSITDAVGRYHIPPDRKGFAPCPFHSEKTPSFKVYADSFYCFGCGEGGDIIDFVMKLFGLDSIGAVKKLNADFMLNLPFDNTQSRLETEKYTEYIDSRNYVQEFEAWEQKTLMNLSRRFREVHERSKTILSPDDPDLQKRISELAEMPFIEWLLDTMLQNKHDFRRRVEFYKEYKETVRYEL